MFVPPSRNNHATWGGWLWAVLLVVSALLSSPAWATLTVTSATFANGGTIPVANMYASGAQCQGNNLSPALQWTPGPAITTTYRVQMVDITAGNFLHWRVDGIPSTTVSLPSGLATNQYTQFNNHFGTLGYGGPCPPNDGLVHQYVITVYALDAVNNIIDSGALAGVRQYSTVAVPNVVNSTQAAAITAINSAGLRVGTITQVANAAPAGTVITQNPPPSPPNVVPGTPVNLQVSGGAAPVNIPVPNIVNQPQATAITLITTANLIVGTVTTQSSTVVPAGSIISQSPAAGTLVAPQSPVNYVVSTGPGTVKVPNVVGQLQGDAINAIQNVGLAVGAVTYQTSTTVPVGAVISQNPVAGDNVVIGKTVDLVVSTGSGATIPVPDVVDLTQSAAVLALQNAGLNVAVTPITYCAAGATSSNCICNPALIVANPTPPPATIDNNPAGCIPDTGFVSGSVIRQFPTAGTGVAPGTYVNIFVFNAGQTAVPNVVGLTQSAAIQAIQNNGLKVTVTTQTSATVPAGIVISQNPVAGILVDSGSTVAIVVSSGSGATNTVPVPDVVDMTQSAAVAAIQAVGLTVGTVTFEKSFTVPAGRVISQNPVGGVLVAPGSAVAIVVSTGTDTTATVPDVVGKTQAEAVAAIQAANLTATVTFEKSFTVPAGRVISQNPVGGIKVAPGSAVAIVISTGTDTTATVPDVVGKTQAEAVAAIQAANLTATVTFDKSFTVPAGRVISQNPVGGIKVAPGSAVAIVISTGTDTTATVPDVVGKTQAEAIAAIQAASLTVTVTFETSTTVPAGRVISQNPVGGVKVAPGSEVAIVVSSGFNPITVPNVVGMTLAAAKTSITGADLTVGTVKLATSDTVPAGNVLSQDPLGGTKVPAKTAVNLVVSSGKEAPVNPPFPPGAIEVPNVKGLTQTAAANTVRGMGLSLGAILKQYSDTVPAGIVLDQSPAAGAKVAVGTPVSLTVSLGPAGVVKVPDVRGLPEETAKTLLQNAGLTNTTLRQPDPTVPAGNAIGTDPSAGTQVKLGSSVILIISTGFSQPQEVAVPGEVIGMTVEDARESLFAVGLFHVGNITMRPHATIPAGRVSGLSPTAGTLVAYGTTINLFVSSGSQPPVSTPNMVGLTLEEAIAKLNATGLQLGFVSHQTSNTVEVDRVISQNPLMTALVPAGWKINLVVSLGPVPQDPGARPTTQVPDAVGLSLATATAKLINAGLQVGLVANEASRTVPAGQVIRQNPPAAATLPVSDKVNLVVSFGPNAYTLLSGPAYITNYAGGTVFVVNPNLSPVADKINIPTGINSSGPSGVAVSPDGTRLYVANRPKYPRTNGTVSVIDLTERQVIAVIPVGVAPLGVAINPTGERVFVANEGSFSLSVIDTSTNQPFVDLNVPNLTANPYPRGVATHPNPLVPLVYVTNRTVNSFSDDEANPQPDQCDALVARPPINVNPDQCVGSLSIFDADLKTQVGSVAVGWAPEGVAVHPNGQYIYVANSGDRTVSVIETVFNRVVGIIALDDFGGAPQPLVPRGVAVSPDGYRLYVTDGAGDRLFVIDTTANHTVVGIVNLRLDNNPRTPYGVSVSPDNRRIYVANTASNTVSVVDSRSNQVIAEIPVGQGPWAFGQFIGPLATVAAPTFTPPAGAYRTGLKVTLTSATAGASIRYTTDGSVPTPTSGTLIANGQAITLALPNPRVATATITLKAIAFKEGLMESEVMEAVYKIRK